MHVGVGRRIVDGGGVGKLGEGRETGTVVEGMGRVVSAVEGAVGSVHWGARRATRPSDSESVRGRMSGR